MNEEAMTLAGKLNHYSKLVEGRFERCLIIHLVKDKARKKEVITIGKQAWVQLVWWLLNLTAERDGGVAIQTSWSMQGGRGQPTY
jgi:hypothetical protein